MKADDDGIAKLYSPFLKDVMGALYSRVIQALLKGGAIGRKPYSDGVSFGYFLKEQFANDRLIRVPATSNRLIKAYNKAYGPKENDRLSRMREIDHKLSALQTLLEIDADEAVATLRQHPRDFRGVDLRTVLIAEIADHSFRWSVGNCGRRFNSITSLSRLVRKHLHVGGKRLASVDLSCAQPAFLAKEMADSLSYVSGFVEPDQSRYASLVQAGTLYDEMGTLLGGEIGRDELKRLFLQDIFAKDGNYHSPVESCFQSHFPSVHRFIRHVNATDHANLIRRLQKRESEFIFDCVAPDFVSRNPDKFLIPLHDAIFSTEDNIEAVAASFSRGFERTGFPMKMKISKPET